MTPSQSEENEQLSFSKLGLSGPLLETLSRMNFSIPTPIQVECIPPGIEGRDIIGIAPTGSGKTAAFAIPILHHLWDYPQGLFACVLSPTRELAFQIASQFDALGATMGVRTAVIVGGDDRVSQAVSLAKKPHVLVATPGRLLDHLKATKGFSLRTIKFMVLDEADRLLDSDFGIAIDEILKNVPQERTTYLFSATLTDKVAKLQRANLRNPARVQVSTKYSTVSSLLQYYLLCPLIKKEVILVSLLNSMVQNSIIVFVRTKASARKLAVMLRVLGFRSVPLYGEMIQSQRLGALNQFKSKACNILIATDLASRGLDIPSVDVVINYDCPTHSKDYIHRVGRTARAGRAGKSILITTQYDVEFIQRLETVLCRQLDLYRHDKSEIDILKERVDEAGRIAINQLKSEDASKSKGGRQKRRISADDRDRDDDEVEAGMPSVSRKKTRR
ncbi:P-loop containing nucleoside triphosphate hydrolase protein [Lentinula detonsa]|uniref:P-loop containing nucleoside triphosphate hydrolase protein n=1 Tax=Lentinula detonsa TaxID=2804962 RepID=A0AA38PVG9_9AGAR|nr:P-loop containing nucleoside triphosphate hydrolase protein [Lentinula detonsa]